MNQVHFKGGNIMQNNKINFMENPSPIAYKMSQTLFDSILKTRSGKDKKINPYVYVTKVVNEEFGFRGKVTRLIVER